MNFSLAILFQHFGSYALSQPSDDSSEDNERSTIFIRKGRTTEHLPKQTIETPEPPSPELPRSGYMRLHLVGTNIQINLPMQTVVELGRPDPVNRTMPDVDLTPYAGYRMGVSRHHARLHWHPDNTLHLYDLGSSNGTFINGKQIQVNQPHPVYNRDIIRLGSLEMYLYYEIKSGDENIIPFRED